MDKQTNPRITFSFGKNWKTYLNTVTDREIASARNDIEQWLGSSAVRGKTVIDIGSGSGIHSLAFLKLGARSIHSLDYDRHSVEATATLWRAEGEPANWTVEHGSILDREYIDSLGTFDIVYSWGVLHHTGAMWQALTNASTLVKPGGTLWISLYRKSPRDKKDLALKQKYNMASTLGKRVLEGRRIARLMASRARHLQNPFTWNQRGPRGMNVYHDVVDWLGGLPYETASEYDVVARARELGFILEGIKVGGWGGCSVYVFSLAAAPTEPAETIVEPAATAPALA